MLKISWHCPFKEHILLVEITKNAVSENVLMHLKSRSVLVLEKRFTSGGKTGQWPLTISCISYIHVFFLPMPLPSSLKHAWSYTEPEFLNI
jgi:hypothetical protein